MRIFIKISKGYLYLIQQGKDSSQTFMNLYNKNIWHLQEMGMWIPEKTLGPVNQFTILHLFFFLRISYEHQPIKEHIQT